MTENNQEDLRSPGHALLSLAEDTPGATAVSFVDPKGNVTTISRRELLDRARAVASYLLAQGVEPDDLVVVSLPKSLEHMFAMLGIWWVGACPLSINVNAPEPEIEKIMFASKPVLILDASSKLANLPSSKGTHIPPRHPKNGGAFLSGGSTGLPKIIRSNSPWGKGALNLLNACGVVEGQTQLVSGPWYHNGPVAWTYFGLSLGHHLVVMEKFEPAIAVDLIRKFQIHSVLLVPTMMNRIAALDGLVRDSFKSVESVVHTSAACPAWLKLKWIDLVGAEQIYEAYGSTEGIGHAAIRGDEWQKHKGSVGKPLAKVEVRAAETEQKPPSGEVGELWWRLPEAGLPFEYLGASPKIKDGFASVGDLGWLDEDGYLYIADRRTDMIISGGSNIFPAEVEGVIGEHPDVLDIVVVGLPDDDWGARVHGILVTKDNVILDLEDLRNWCKERMAAFKAPRSLEFLETLPRNEAGKIRRQELRNERIGNGCVIAALELEGGK